MSIKTKEKEKSFEIVIQDSGSGMDKKNLSKIFDPFYTTKEKHAGLGLSIAQGILENHKGKIRIKSRAGFGTEVVVELPKTEREG